MNARIILLATFTGVMLTGCVVNPPECNPNDINQFCTFDKLNDAMTKRVQDKLIISGSFQIFPNDFNLPVGTVITISEDKKKFNIKSDDACAPIKSLVVRPSPSLFPDYVISKNAAGTVGVNSEVIANLISAGINMNGNRKMTFSSKGTVASWLSDEDLKKVLKKSRCIDNTRDGSALVVRGYVMGQRTFHLEKGIGGGVNLATKIATFSLTGDRKDVVIMKDDQPQRYILFLSAVEKTPYRYLSNNSKAPGKITWVTEVKKPEYLEGMQYLEVRGNEVIFTKEDSKQ